MENIMKDLLLHFSALSIAVTFGMAFLWLLMGSASNARPPFVNAKAFPELAGLGREEQKRLLETAITIVVFVLPGAWFAGRLSANHIRLFLKKCIEESNNAA